MRGLSGEAAGGGGEGAAAARGSGAGAGRGRGNGLRRIRAAPEGRGRGDGGPRGPGQTARGRGGAMAEAVGAGPAPGGGASGRGRGSRHGVPRGAAEGARRAVGSLHSFPSPGRAQAAERRPHGAMVHPREALPGLVCNAEWGPELVRERGAARVMSTARALESRGRARVVCGTGVWLFTVPVCCATASHKHLCFLRTFCSKQSWAIKNGSIRRVP